MSDKIDTGIAKLSVEQQDYVLEMIAAETGNSNNVVIVESLKAMFGVTMTSQAVQYYRGKKYEDLIAKKRDVNDSIIRKKVPLANKLTRVRAFADMHNEIDWRRSGIVHHQGEIIAEIEKKEYGAKIKCLENIREEMEPTELGEGGNGDRPPINVIFQLPENGMMRKNGTGSSDSNNG